jgi:hypothetical protein
MGHPVNYEPPAHLRRRVALAIQGHITQLRLNGCEPPAGLEAYAERLLAPDADMLTRRRYLNRHYKRRSRAKQKENRAA